jgi:hypothetical protein
MLELFTGSDRYGVVAYQEAGYMTEQGIAAAEDAGEVRQGSRFQG